MTTLRFNPILVSEYVVTRNAAELWRTGGSSGSSSGSPSPFDEPMFRALIKSIVHEVNTALSLASVSTVPETEQTLTHLCCWDPSGVWIPVCQRITEQRVAPHPTCVACAGHAKEVP